MTTMRVGILANPMVQRWQQEAVENIRALDDVEVTLALVDSSEMSEDSELSKGADVLNEGGSIGIRDISLFFELLGSQGWYPLVYADQKLGWLFGDGVKRLEYMQSTPVDEAACLSGVDVRYCEPIPEDGAWESLPDEVVDEIAERTDVVVRFGFGLLKGRILEEPEYGVLSAHGSDIREARGLGPQTIFLSGKDAVTVTLQQLTTEVDGGRVVCMLRKPVEKPYTLSEVWGWVNELQTEIYAAGIRNLLDPDFEIRRPATLGEYYSKSQKRSAPFVLGLLLKNNRARLHKAYRALS